VHYRDFQINHSDREVMLTSVAFPLSTELLAPKWEMHKWSKDVELGVNEIDELYQYKAVRMAVMEFVFARLRIRTSSKEQHILAD
jgi:hypothetical protein